MPVGIKSAVSLPAAPTEAGQDQRQAGTPARQLGARLRDILNDANLCLADGIGIPWAAHYLPLPGRPSVGGQAGCHARCTCLPSSIMEGGSGKRQVKATVATFPIVVVLLLLSGCSSGDEQAGSSSLDQPVPFSFTRYDSNPLLRVAPGWESGWIHPYSVLPVGDAYWMW